MRNIPFGKPLIGDEERQAVMNVLNGTILVHGPLSHEFENSFSAFTGAPYSVSLSSCTAGLHLSYFYLGLGPGDEVIVPAQTHTATAHAVELCGAKPVFVDAEPHTGNIDLDLIENSLTDRTRAISIVHFLGMPVDMNRLMTIAKRHSLFVVEDCALAIGTYFQGIHAGLHGDVGCFSFYPVKHMTTAEGGMLITRHEQVAKRIIRQRAFGVDRHVGERVIPGVYDVPQLGFNYRMSEIHAAIGIEQLKRIPEFLRKRQSNHEILTNNLKSLQEINLLQSTHGEFQSSYYCLSIILNDHLAGARYEIVTKLKQAGIGTSIYYPKPVPHMTYYKQKYDYADNSFPVAAHISYCTISLPVGPHLNEEDMLYIANTFKQIIQEVK